LLNCFDFLFDQQQQKKATWSRLLDWSSENKETMVTKRRKYEQLKRAALVCFVHTQSLNRAFIRIPF